MKFINIAGNALKPICLNCISWLLLQLYCLNFQIIKCTNTPYNVLHDEDNQDKIEIVITDAIDNCYNVYDFLTTSMNSFVDYRDFLNNDTEMKNLYKKYSDDIIKLKRGFESTLIRCTENLNGMKKRLNNLKKKIMWLQRLMKGKILSIIGQLVIKII